MEFKQSRLATKIEFEFDDDELIYSMQDNTSNLNFEVGYGKLPKRSQTFYERNIWLRNVGLIWVVLGVGFTLWNLVQSGTLSVNFWTWVGLLCLIAYRATWSEYTYFDTDEGRVLVLKDSQSESIVDELISRRRKAYLDWFENLEFENSDQLEQTLAYLVKEKILTKEESDLKFEMIGSGKHLKLVSSNDPSPENLH